MKNAILPLLPFILAGCAITPVRDTAPLPPDAPLSGYFLIHNVGLYDGIEETDISHKYTGEIKKLGGEARAKALAHNFCAEQGMEHAQIGATAKELVFVCFNKQSKKRAFVPVPSIPEAHPYNQDLQEIKKTVKMYIKQKNIHLLSEDKDVISGWKETPVPKDFPSYMKGVDLIGFFLNSNTRHEITYLMSCKDHRDSEVGTATFRPMFSSDGYFVKTNGSPRAISTNSSAHRIWRAICQSERNKNTGKQKEEEITITRKKAAQPFP